MKNTIKKFLQNESGAASFDAVVVIGGAMWMLIAVVVDISSVTIDLADRVNNELRYNSVVYDILEGYGPNSRKVR